MANVQFNNGLKAPILGLGTWKVNIQIFQTPFKKTPNQLF